MRLPKYLIFFLMISRCYYVTKNNSSFVTMSCRLVVQSTHVATPWDIVLGITRHLFDDVIMTSLRHMETHECTTCHPTLAFLVVITSQISLLPNNLWLYHVSWDATIIATLCPMVDYDVSGSCCLHHHIWLNVLYCVSQRDFSTWCNFIGS